jgi:hypothetical protein
MLNKVFFKARNMRIKKEEIIRNCFVGVRDEDRLSTAYEYVSSFIQSNNLKSLNKDEESVVKDALAILKKKFVSKFTKSRSWSQLERVHQDFLENDLEYEFETILTSSTSSIFEITTRLKPGRKKKKYADKRRTAQWITVKKLTENDEFDSTALLEAALIKSNVEKNFARAVGIKTVLKKKKRIVEKPPVKNATASESFELYLSNNLSQRQYKSIKIFFDSHNAKILPSYDKLLITKKECHPEGIVVSDLEASVSIQNLFQHVATRLLVNFNEEFCNKMEASHENLVIIFAYGLDGSSGYSHYNMPVEVDRCDQNLVAVTCVPIRITTPMGRIVWQNPSTASSRSCLPIKLIFAKEDKALTKEIYADLKDQINKLTPLAFSLSENLQVTVEADFHLALIDGKVLADLTDTGYASCALCKRPPREFNSLRIWEENKTVTSNPQVGISPLHARLRIFEHLVKIGYKKVTGKARSGSDAAVIKNMAVVRKRFLDLLNLRVDQPSPRGGNSNTGNVSRKAFENAEIFAQCVGFDAAETEVIIRLRNVLACITSPHEIDTAKFKIYCYETHKIYINFFSWYPMSSTLHKVLYHGHELMQNFTIPLGLMTEESSESKNKFYKRDRLQHARQSSRAANLEDIFHRALEMSDPFFSTIALRKIKSKKNHMMLPDEVMDMLKNPLQSTELSLCDDDHDEIIFDVEEEWLDDVFLDEEHLEDDFLGDEAIF